MGVLLNNGRSGSDSGCETDYATNAHPVLIRTQKLHLDDISINEADDSNYVYIRNNKSGDNSPSIQHMVSAQNSIPNLNDLISDSNKHGQNFLTINTKNFSHKRPCVMWFNSTIDNISYSGRSLTSRRCTSSSSQILSTSRFPCIYC
jgi:sarcosine oxidase delta subunit